VLDLSVTISPDHQIIRSPDHPITRSPDGFQSPDYPITRFSISLAVSASFYDRHPDNRKRTRALFSA
jgi:hypothetical protein